MSSDKQQCYLTDSQDQQDAPCYSQNSRTSYSQQQRHNQTLGSMSAIKNNALSAQNEIWQPTGKPFELKVYDGTSPALAEKAGTNSSLYYEVIGFLKKDIKSIIENYIISLKNTPDKIKLICIRNSLLATLTNEVWELNQLDCPSLPKN